MKYFLPSTLVLTLFSTFFLFSENSFAQKADKAALKSISPELMKQYIGFLASDALLGRNTPSPELDTAAAFIARMFRLDGVSPINGSYYQPFQLCKTDLDTGNYLRILEKAITTEFPIKTGFVPYYINKSASFNGEIVFAGYGITAPEYNYDDYQGIDVRSKTVLVFKHEPCENDSGSFFDGKEITKYSGLNTKRKTASERGASAMLVVSEPGNYPSLKPRGHVWPSLTKSLPADAVPFTMCNEEENELPTVQVGEEAVKALFGSIDSLKSLQQKIDNSHSPCSFPLPGKEIRLGLKTRVTERQVVNVVGYIEGSDPVLKDELVVIGAHYDHLGFKKQLKPGEDNIYNGADDNASGTAGVMAIARAFASAKTHPRRSLVFILFAGEEKGLYGSDYYTNHPIFPLDKTVAMLNLDMIGRNAPNSLNLVGAASSPDIAAITRKENKKVGFKLVDDNSVMGGSDHFNFYKKGIPFMFYFSGLHVDYHQVGDNPDKIDYDKASRVARLAFLTAWHIANDNQHYSIIKKD